MPTYVYRREDGTTFEIKQRITEDPLETCPETGQDVERIITGNAGLIFKGDGFYVNDYGNGNGSSHPSTTESDEAASTDETSSSKSSSASSSESTSSESTSSAGSDDPAG